MFQNEIMPARIKFFLFLPFLLLIFLLNGTTVFAQEVPFAPPEVGNSQVQKAQGAAFREGWNFFTLGFGGCTAKIVLNELQADGGSALKAETLFVKELFNWQAYSILNSDSEKKKIGGGDLLAFYSNQKFFFEMDQKACSNPDRERQSQINIVREGTSAKGSFVEKVRELPIDLWTKLIDLLNQSGASPAQNIPSGNKQVFENLTIGGKTTVNDLGVTGTISAGLLAINGLDSFPSTGSGQTFASIDTLSNDLYIQSKGLGGVNILAGKVTIDKEGNLKIKKLIIDLNEPSSSSLGSGTIQSGSTSQDIQTSSVSQSSKIFVTATSETGGQALIVKTKRPGVGFKVIIEKPYASDITFDWFIIN